MNSLLLTALFVLSVPVMAERVSLKSSDPATDLLFSQLGKFRMTPNETQGLTATERALEALLADLALQIKHLHDYTGIFTANCSVHFNDAIEQADCDIQPAHSRSLMAGAKFVPAHQLSEQYRHPITQSNILFSNIFVDWTDGQTQEFDSDLYFRQGTCSKTMSATLETILSRTSSKTPSKSLSETLTSILSPTKTKTFTATIEHPRTLSLSASSTQSKTMSRRLSPSLTLSESPSKSLLETMTSILSPTKTQTLTATKEHLRTPSLTSSSTQSVTSTESLLPACSPVPPVTGLLAAWNQAGDTYQDGTSQPSRYFVAGNVVTDSLTGMQWQQIASAFPMNWTASETYCSEQTTGGLSGWRVPNIVELGTLVDYTISYPTVPINTGAFPGTPATSFWASSPVIGEPGHSWDVWFGADGESFPEPVTNSGNVRCVRSCYPTPPAERYAIASGVVTDTATALIWQQHSSAGIYPSTGLAQAYCDELDLAGYTWRLPTIKELVTLVDYSVSQGGLMMDSIAFAGESAACYLTSATLMESSIVVLTWYVAFNNGIVNSGGGVPEFGCAVRCLASS